MRKKQDEGEQFSARADGLVPPSACPSPRACEALSAGVESRAFRRMRRRVLATLLWQTFCRARFRLSLVVLLTSLLWMGMYWMFHQGFSTLDAAFSSPELHARAIGFLFSAFSAALMLMLVFSSGVILYGALFCSREISFLLTVPASTERVFLHKFQEAIVLSSWGFVLLGSPALLAYGAVAEAPWYYYALLLPFLVAFIYIPVAIGAIICMWVVRHLPNRRSTVLAVAVALLVGGVTWMAWNLFAGSQNNLLTPSWFQEILDRLRISDQRLLPSWWLSTGILNAAAGIWQESVLFLALLISNALLFRQLALWTAVRTYRAAYSGLCDKRGRRRARHTWLGRLLARPASWIPTTARLMMIKDVRLFRRDPLQWSQFLIFLSLLALYFLNVRRFTYDVSSIAWVNLISFLNLAVVGLLLSTFTTRFIYPMISLEGRRFWILGLLGVRRDTILWSKFAFAVLGSIIPCSSLVLMSDAMLKVQMLVVVSHQLTCLVLCVGLAGIAVGLGAWLPSLREESPSRIAAGFGGTMTLVVSTLYILIIVLLTALPTHFYLVATYSPKTSQLVAGQWLMWWLIGGVTASLVLGTLATVIPLRVGFRAFRKMEFS